MAASFDFDLFVIGGGSGGVRLARTAASMGAHVALAEAAELGGTCVNVGCIPKKLYSYAAHYADAFHESAGYGWDLPGTPVLDWERLKRRRADEIRRLNGVYRKLLEGANVTLLQGWAQLAGPHEVVLDGRTYRARHIALATGGTPVVPSLPGAEQAVTSDQVFDLEPFPRRMLIVGGGYIACEFASIFNGLGAQVTLVQRAGSLLTGFDGDVRRFLASEMGKTGVDIRLDAQVASMARRPAGFDVLLASGTELQVDAVLYAIGRRANTQGLGLHAAGVAMDDHGAVVVDAHYQTSVPSIHAIGDVSSSKKLTPVALAEGMVLAHRLFGDGRRTVGYDNIPTAVFTHPNVGTVGLSEEEARARGGEIDIYRSDFKPLRHTLSGRDERTLMKLVVDRASDRVLGLHMVGADAGEIVQGFAVALRAGATKAVFDSTIGIHPTAAEEFVTMRQPVRPDA